MPRHQNISALITNRNRPSVSKRHRQGQQHQQRPDQGVHQADEKRRDQRRAEAGDDHPAIEMGHQQQGGGQQQPANDDLHGAQDSVPRRLRAMRRGMATTEYKTASQALWTGINIRTLRCCADNEGENSPDNPVQCP